MNLKTTLSILPILLLATSCWSGLSREKPQLLNLYIDSILVGKTLGLIDTTIQVKFLHESALIVLHDSIAVKFFHVYNPRTKTHYIKEDFFWNVENCWKRWALGGYGTVMTEKRFRDLINYRNNEDMNISNMGFSSPPTGEHLVKMVWSITREE